MADASGGCAGRDALLRRSYNPAIVILLSETDFEWDCKAHTAVNKHQEQEQLSVIIPQHSDIGVAGAHEVLERREAASGQRSKSQSHPCRTPIAENLSGWHLRDTNGKLAPQPGWHFLSSIQKIDEGGYNGSRCLWAPTGGHGSPAWSECSTSFFLRSAEPRQPGLTAGFAAAAVRDRGYDYYVRSVGGVITELHNQSITATVRQVGSCCRIQKSSEIVRPNRSLVILVATTEAAFSRSFIECSGVGDKAGGIHKVVVTRGGLRAPVKVISSVLTFIAENVSG
ncbi:hypothetical protein BKA93DRAFT_844595 [Sparassis latifolia]